MSDPLADVKEEYNGVSEELPSTSSLPFLES